MTRQNKTDDKKAQRIVADGIIAPAQSVKARLTRAMLEARKSKRVVKRVWKAFGPLRGYDLPAKAGEVFEKLEAVQGYIDGFDDRVGDIVRRLEALEAKAFPQGVPVAAATEEEALQKSGQDLVDKLMAPGKSKPKLVKEA